ncbi:ORF5 protein [Operophtera brumata nucleopolyhedrovirus]|uniref:ORF5 protein n=1 Tax=Operophtera brumata nucleopolyhedrovirus TaxID=1046267 RepID=A0A2H4UZP1_9ABAC|nr:ORF5 protein [Operophtera brumata nucleopolyhedrovirus]AUA60236.1 ORF5 protein [Operophtera brumata nucleopolyhedrovirus]
MSFDSDDDCRMITPEPPVCITIDDDNEDSNRVSSTTSDSDSGTSDLDDSGDELELNNNTGHVMVISNGVVTRSNFLPAILEEPESRKRPGSDAITDDDDDEDTPAKIAKRSDDLYDECVYNEWIHNFNIHLLDIYCDL